MQFANRKPPGTTLHRETHVTHKPIFAGQRIHIYLSENTSIFLKWRIKMNSIIRPMTPKDKNSVLEMMRVFYEIGRAHV